VSFLAPWFLAAGGAAALAVLVLHLIVTREPAVTRLPTARFAPDREIEARAPALEPRDLVLFLLRAGAVLAAAAALAGPMLKPGRRPLLRVVLLDRSGYVARPSEASDSARTLLRAGDLLVLFDSAGRLASTDSIAPSGIGARTGAPGNISAALVTALRAAASHRDRADSIQLILISPVAAAELDAATDSVRARWPAGIRLVRIAGDTGITASLEWVAPAADPLRVALPAAAEGSSPSSVRLVRQAPRPEDESWSRGAGHTLVLWPGDASVPPGWIAEAAPDTAAAVVAEGRTVVAPFVRRLRLDSSAVSGARIVARWVDGAPAAIERASGEGCLRTIALDVPAVGDLVLTARFAALAGRLTAPCGTLSRSAPAGSAEIARLVGSAGPARASLLAGLVRRRSPWEPVLLALALGLLAAETFIRRRRPA
jgi:hypothetical protein